VEDQKSTSVRHNKPAQPTKLFGATHNPRAAKNFDYFINDYFINAIVKGEEDLNYLDTP
jgi:hypothetical protein